ncbi:MAG: Rap1a/Tai family immunity protein [Burkholderiales bacterium]|nr:Rap1a/Tai family immunity protein [Burkholderiales bacterium]
MGLCLAITGSAAHAQGWTHDGPELAQFAAEYEKLRDSGAPTDDPAVAASVAYFNGFVLGVARANADRGWYCLPADATAGQVWDAVAAFLREHPELRERRPSTLVNGALAKRFPCREDPTAKPKADQPSKSPSKARAVTRPKAAQ